MTTATLKEVENRFYCSPTRRLIAGMILAALIAVIGNWFINGPLTDAILAKIRPPLTIHSATITTPVVHPGDFLKVRLDSTKYRECGGTATSWLEAQDLTIYNLGTNPLGVQNEFSSRRTIIILVPIPKYIPPGKYRLIRTLEYNPCPDEPPIIRFPDNLVFTVIP